MHKIASKHIEELKRSKKTWREVYDHYTGFVLKHRVVLLMGLGSFVLYASFFAYSSELISVLKVVSTGDKSMFLVPIVLAFIFSAVHGAFTAKFWDVLGVKAKTVKAKS